MGVRDSGIWINRILPLGIATNNPFSLSKYACVIIAADGVAVIQSMFTADDSKANTKVVTSSIDLVVTVIISFGTCAPILMLNTKARHIPFATLIVLWVIMFQSKS